MDGQPALTLSRRRRESTLTQLLTEGTAKIVWVEEDQKKRALYDLLLALPPARTIIFVNSKRTADLIDDYLFNLDLPSTSIHADRTQREREDAL